MKYDIIVIGNFPPPIGGVSIHVKRLLERLKVSEFKYLFVDLRRERFWLVAASIFNGKIIHLHSSNSYLKFCFSLTCFLSGRPLLLTHHGNINRYGKVKNFIDRISLRMAKVPVMINQQSYLVARQLNSNARLASAFIPPNTVEKLVPVAALKLTELKSISNFLFCTNAFNVSYDKNKREIYQVTQLITLFNKYSYLGLIISDPTGNYKRFIEARGLSCKQNVVFLDFQHDFNAVIAECDCMIRFTTTDGDSLSVKEALFAGKNVIATNVVDRPGGVILVNDDPSDLEQKINSFIPAPVLFEEDGYTEISKIYAEYLNR